MSISQESEDLDEYNAYFDRSNNSLCDVHSHCSETSFAENMC
jgi:hypothetical protein